MAVGRRRWLVPALIGTVVVAAVVRGPAEYRTWRDRGLKGQSVDQLESNLARNPKDPDAKYFLAMALVREGSLEKAPRLLREALLLDPVRHDILNDLGAVYLVQRRYYESLVALQGAVTAKPDYAPAWANLGRLHIAMEMAYTAAKELRKSLDLEPGNTEVLCDYGEACRRTLNYKGGEAAYREAIGKRPEHVRAHTGLALILQEKGSYDEALKSLETANRLQPDDPAILTTMGGILLRKDGGEAGRGKAEPYLRKAVELDPSLADGWYNLGNFELLAGRPKVAVEHLAKALQFAPDHMGILNLLERALRRSGRVADADRAAKVFRARAMRDREETVLEERTHRNAEDWDAVARLAELYLGSNKRYKAVWMTNRLKVGAPYHPKLPRLLQIIGPDASPTAADTSAGGG